jgi:hypothetical protein
MGNVRNCHKTAVIVNSHTANEINRRQFSKITNTKIHYNPLGCLETKQEAGSYFATVHSLYAMAAEY